jgi:hypothetical protein
MGMKQYFGYKEEGIIWSKGWKKNGIMAGVGCGQSGVCTGVGCDLCVVMWVGRCGVWPVRYETCVGWQGCGVIFVDCGRCLV